MSRTPDFNSGSWKVYDHGNHNPPKLLETCKSHREACRSMWIFTAHELKNDRVANFRIVPAEISGPIPWEELDLPSWAKKELTKIDQEKKVSAFFENAKPGIATIGDAPKRPWNKRNHGN